MDVIAAACTLAVIVALAWRILEHRASGEAAVRLGATTRAVPARHRTRPTRTSRRTPGSPPRSSGGAPRRYPSTGADRTPTTTQLLERDHR
jgi:hypothetical protein